MNYRELAEEFCGMRIQDAKRVARIEEAMMVKGESNVLLYLADYEEGVLAGQIARELGLSASRGTNILNSLEKKGLVIRRNDAEDRRKVYISLTEEGKKTMMAHYNEFVSDFEEVFRELGEEDAKEYIRILKRLTEIMEKKKK
ncbi:MAG: MarR family transcriptional regulator [Eubacteriales bacterium]|nr:MarR family transcriptional regulator [Eubacteriales bacterium]